MKTELLRLARNLWDTVSEVPGWPDAPRLLRIQRAVPVLLPCAAAVLLWGWEGLVLEPGRAGERAAHLHLIALEEEVGILRLSCSEQQASDLAVRSAEALGRVFRDPEAASAWLREMREPLATLGWQATFQTYDSSGETTPGQAVEFAPALARLTATDANQQPLSTLLSALDRLSAPGSRIDLTRLSVRVEEGGRPAADINLRIAVRADHEKAAE